METLTIHLGPLSVPPLRGDTQAQPLNAHPREDDDVHSNSVKMATHRSVVARVTIYGVAFLCTYPPTPARNRTQRRGDAYLADPPRRQNDVLVNLQTEWP